MATRIGFRQTLFTILQWLGMMIGFPVSFLIADRLFPLPQTIVDAPPYDGFLPFGLAFFVNAAVNTIIIYWAAKRSSFRGVTLWAQLFILMFGTQTFLTQIESGYFLSAFPLMQGHFVVYSLIARGFVSALLFTLAGVALSGGFKNSPRLHAHFALPVERTVKTAAWLAAVYVALYGLFGYYVAWQSQAVRLFYAGPAELNSFTDQWAATLMARPEFPVVQYFRGVLWILCLIPIMKGFTGRRMELVAFSALAFALLPTVQMTFPNPLMPTEVSHTHFWEVSISTGIFGALCAYVIPVRTRAHE